MALFGGEKQIVGYDLGNEFCQISFALSDSAEAQTVSQVAGAQSYNIPAALCKRPGSGQWLYGREALRCAEEQQGVLIENLFGQALDGEPVFIQGERFDPTALLALFFRRSLGLLQAGSLERVGAMMITCEMVDGRVLEVLSQMVAAVGLKTDKVFIQSHTESYYHYMLRQPQELWRNGSMLFDYRGNCMRVYQMTCNRRTAPVAVFIRETVHPFYAWEPLPRESGARQRRCQELDAAFLRLAESETGENADSVYLIGDGFEQEWMKESLPFLCRGRRVFQGNNLFGKGACYGMQERLRPSPAGKAHVFLGKDKLKANVGMEVFRQGEASYYALLDAGVNWYEADYTGEFYVQDGGALTLRVTSLMGKSGREARICLEDFPGGIGRVRARFFMEAENVLAVEIEDLGFGVFRPSSGRVWKERIPL